MLKTISNFPKGYTAFFLSECVKKNTVIYFAQDEKEIEGLSQVLELIDKRLKVFIYPQWNTVPYDRINPDKEIVAKQIKNLIFLKEIKEKVIVLTTVSSAMQKIPPYDFFKNKKMLLKKNEEISFDFFQNYLYENGYTHVSTVINKGEYAVRGGILDVFLPLYDMPVRLDFFGNELEEIKFFNPISQTTESSLKEIEITPISYFVFNQESISLFRSKFRELFPIDYKKSFFYNSISSGEKTLGLEQFFPLFHNTLSTFLSYCPKDSSFVFYDDMEKIKKNRWEQIEEYFFARQQALQQKIEDIYHPLPSDIIYIHPEKFEEELSKFKCIKLHTFLIPNTKTLNVQAGYDFTSIRKKNDKDIFTALFDYLQNVSKKVILSIGSNAFADRISHVMQEKGIFLERVSSFSEAFNTYRSVIVSLLEKGFQTEEYIILTEADIFGERIYRTLPKKKRNNNFISDVLSLTPGALVVHQTHGIGRFLCLEPVSAGGIIHDCLCLEYADGDRLFVPVENIEVLSLYGSQEVALDKIGGSFEQRKARVKKDLFIMADKLIQLASQRKLTVVPKIDIPYGLYQEFCSKFPYTETEDQLQTISEIERDFSLGRPMDRLVCGDVGFGKTEVALRASFLAVMAGYQVAVIVPTTLLAQQHLAHFKKRYDGFPVHIEGLSRLVSSSASKKIKQSIIEGKTDIVIGTHAVLSKDLLFKKLGLIIVDEEQHFGVSFKEKLKELAEGVHILTLSATPIPRTLQLSLSGLKEMSIIATPPVDRMVVSTYIMPFDHVIIKEALQREKFREGQSFFVCPRISDLPKLKEVIHDLLPDLKVIEAHGQMPGKILEEIMADFVQKKYDVLLTTSIIESGLDLPSVNTIIVYRADLFGLAALYQMRGRVGRGKTKAYAYFTTPSQKEMGMTVQKRLSVLQGLDTLGAGFTLASHDLDIRGAGNLLGDKQSGHIKEVGISLYQKMLAEAVQETMNQEVDNKEENKEVKELSPQVLLGVDVLIPESYISDIDVRMQLYRRLGELETTEDIFNFEKELIDRFGNFPKEVKNLCKTVIIKQLAKKAGIERVEIGPLGGIITFYKNEFKNPQNLINFVIRHFTLLKIRPDQKITILEKISNPEERIEKIEKILKDICSLLEDEK